MVNNCIVNAQTNTNSPYSKLGLGDFESMGFGRNAGMGGCGIALRNEFGLNSLNPASLTALDSQVVIMELGVHADYTQLQTANQKGALWDGNFSYLALGFALNNRWFMSFGVAPYTNVGYNIQITTPISGSIYEYNTAMEGSGGLSSLYFSGAYKISKLSSIGLNTSLLFGPKNETQTYSLTSDDNFYVTQKVSNKYAGFKFDLGYQQTIPLAAKSNLVLGATVNAPGYLHQRQTIFVTKTDNDGSYVDTLRDEDEILKKVHFPINFGCGIAYNYKEKLTITMDYSLYRWSEITIEDQYSEYINNHSYNLGTEYRLKIKPINKQFDCRAGFTYQSGYLLVNKQKLQSLGVTTGLGFQIRDVKYNLYAEYNWRGFTNNNMIREDFVRVGLNISLLDLWFQKRKFH